MANIILVNIVSSMRGNTDNLLLLYNSANQFELEEGRVYYDLQLERLKRRAEVAGLNTKLVVGAYAALSPNASELSNYAALDQCIRIANGVLPRDSKVRAYPLNKTKALQILAGADPEWVLGGQKVHAFFYNTMDPDCNTHITIDGHMLGAWCNERFALNGRNARRPGATMREARFLPGEYRQATKDFIEAATINKLSAPRFQSILWLTWKRKHRILYNPQLKFSWEDNPHT